MAIRVSKLLRESNLGLTMLEEILNALGFADKDLTLNSIIPDDMATLVKGMTSNDIDLLKFISIAAEKGVYNNQNGSIFPLKNLGRID